MDRAAVLEEASRLITTDRESAHGSPSATLTMIAEMWSSYLGVQVTATDACNMMILLKVARSRANLGNVDNHIDAAGYAGLAAELSNH